MATPVGEDTDRRGRSEIPNRNLGVSVLQALPEVECERPERRERIRVGRHGNESRPRRAFNGVEPSGDSRGVASVPRVRAQRIRPDAEALSGGFRRQAPVTTSAPQPKTSAA